MEAHSRYIGQTYVDAKGEIEQQPENDNGGVCAGDLRDPEWLDQEDKNQDGTGDPYNSGRVDIGIDHGDPSHCKLS